MLDDLKKIQRYSKILEKTFDWGCNDEARDLYANAVYEIATHNKAFEGAEKEFEEYVLNYDKETERNE